MKGQPIIWSFSSPSGFLSIVKDSHGFSVHGMSHEELEQSTTPPPQPTLPFEQLSLLSKLTISCTNAYPNPDFISSVSPNVLLTTRVKGTEFTCLDLAARSGLMKVVLVLTERCPELLKVGTPCAWAAFAGHVDVIRFLAKMGAETRLERLSDGSSALHLAAENVQLESVRVLCEEFGMSPLLLNNSGHSVLDRLAPTNSVETRAIKRYLEKAVNPLSGDGRDTLVHMLGKEAEAIVMCFSQFSSENSSGQRPVMWGNNLLALCLAANAHGTEERVPAFQRAVPRVSLRGSFALEISQPGVLNQTSKLSLGGNVVELQPAFHRLKPLCVGAASEWKCPAKVPFRLSCFHGKCTLLSICKDCLLMAQGRLDALSAGNVVASAGEFIKGFAGAVAWVSNQQGLVIIDHRKLYSKGDIDLAVSTLLEGNRDYLHPQFVALFPNFLWGIILHYGSLEGLFSSLSQGPPLPALLQLDVPAYEPWEHFTSRVFKCARSECHQFGAVLKCSRCRLTHYCSAECSEADWTMHQSQCHKAPNEQERAQSFVQQATTGPKKKGAPAKKGKKGGKRK